LGYWVIGLLGDRVKVRVRVRARVRVRFELGVVGGGMFS
jgi:hypothetical protein